MKTEYPGIDYSIGKSNFNPETKIHFGVIPLNACGEFAFDEFETDYGDPYCPECGNTVLDNDDRCDKDYYCPKCNDSFYSDHCAPDNPISYKLDTEEYKASYSPDDSDVWIFNSPYYTYAQFCSPCAPGAGYLLNPCETGPKTYCLGHDWFENNTAPYPVYSVATNELIEPNKE